MIPRTSPRSSGLPIGRNVIAVIGIDRYRGFRPLENAVRDASTVRTLFLRLGFEEITPPLFDEAASGQALQSLVTDDLRPLTPHDSLVLFYAGHGCTQTRHVAGEEIKVGHLIPADAASEPNKVATWIDLHGWLRKVSLLPARHILVILDACHGGIALEPAFRWRDVEVGSPAGIPLAPLQDRRSRRIITSALDDQPALDGGPMAGHSLFASCLIEGLAGDLARDGRRFVTGSELGLYVQRRVRMHPGARQTPDFGAFDLDDRGELLIPLRSGSSGRPVGRATGPCSDLRARLARGTRPHRPRRRQSLSSAGYFSNRLREL